MLVTKEQLKLIKNFPQNKCVCCHKESSAAEWGRTFRAEVSESHEGHNFRFCNECIERFANDLMGFYIEGEATIHQLKHYKKD